MLTRHISPIFSLPLLSHLSSVLADSSPPPSPTASTISIFLPDTDSQTLLGSILSSSSPNALTTLSIACPPDSPDTDCGFPNGATVTIGPSTFSGTYDIHPETWIYDCHGSLLQTQNPNPSPPSDIVCSGMALDGNTTITSGVSTLDSGDNTLIVVTLTNQLGAAGTDAAGVGGLQAAASATGWGATAATTTTRKMMPTPTGSGNGNGTTHTSGAPESGSKGGQWQRSVLAGLMAIIGVVAALL